MYHKRIRKTIVLNDKKTIVNTRKLKSDSKGVKITTTIKKGV